MNIKRVKAIFIARNREFFRDRGALTWNLAFPILLILGFYVVFSGEGREQLKVGVVNSEQVPVALNQLRYVDFIEYQDIDIAKLKVAQHQLDLLIDWPNQQFYINENSAKGYFAQNILVAHYPALDKQVLSGNPLRYVDWVMPGILGMNMMFSCLFGVGYVIVRYRKNGVLKRLQATPVTALEFVSAQILSRFVIVVVLSFSMLLACWQLLDLRILGSLWLLLLIFALGTLSLVALGLLVASRSHSEELTGGLLNFASWPMMFLSGVWFSLEGAPELVHWLAALLPLTHFIDAARAVMLDGAQFQDLLPQLSALGGMTLLFLLIAAVFFHWGKSR